MVSASCISARKHQIKTTSLHPEKVSTENDVKPLAKEKIRPIYNLRIPLQICEDIPNVVFCKRTEMMNLYAFTGIMREVCDEIFQGRLNQQGLS